MKYNVGDQLLFALSDRRRLRLSDVQLILSEIIDPEQMVALTNGGKSVRQVAAEIALVLDALGHCDYIADELLFVAPPALAMLIVPGRARAIVCGARSPLTESAIRSTPPVASMGLSLAAVAGSSVIVPRQLLLTASTVEELELFAEKAGLAFSHSPATQRLLSICGSVDEYIRSLEWKTQPEPNWVRTDFDAESLRFTRGSFRGNRLRLSRYWNERRHRAAYLLWCGEESASVDPAWARFAVLQDRPSSAVDISRDRCTLSLPSRLPLPPLIARALTLCSGYPPTIAPADVRATIASHIVYHGIPPDVLDQVAEKLGLIIGRTSYGVHT